MEHASDAPLASDAQAFDAQAFDAQASDAQAFDAQASDAQANVAMAVAVPRKAGRQRKFPDLAPGEKGTRAQREAIYDREFSRKKRAKDVEAFNKHQMELYYARKARQAAEKLKMEQFMTAIKSIIV